MQRTRRHGIGVSLGIYLALLVLIGIQSEQTHAVTTGVELNAEHFPDVTFRNYVASFDQNNDNQLEFSCFKVRMHSYRPIRRE